MLTVKRKFKNPKSRKLYVYDGKKIVDILSPWCGWYCHSTHGKDLDFVEMFRFGNSDEMLEKEYEMIQKYHPSCNKITKRKQNLNAELTPEVLESRKGDAEWCQCCFRRHVRPGYKYCYYCSTGR